MKEPRWVECGSCGGEYIVREDYAFGYCPECTKVADFLNNRKEPDRKP